MVLIGIDPHKATHTARTQAVCRLHALIAALTPGGVRHPGPRLLPGQDRCREVQQGSPTGVEAQDQRRRVPPTTPRLPTPDMSGSGRATRARLDSSATGPTP